MPLEPGEFGHGIFQQCIIKPVLNQMDLTTLSKASELGVAAPSVLINDRRAIIGVEICPPKDYKGSVEAFGPSIIEIINAVEFSYQILFNSDKITLESSYNSSMQSTYNSGGKNKSYRVTASGLLLFLEAWIKIPEMYTNCPLKLSVSLNVVSIGCCGYLCRSILLLVLIVVMRSCGSFA